MLRGAIVGLGNVAINGHLPGWEGCERAQIVAAADAMQTRLDEARCRLPTAGLYTDVEALLSSEPLDFLDICTPPVTHASLIRLALDRGLHVLCEKPLVLSTDELRMVTRAQVDSACVLHTVHNWQYAPIILKATDLIRQGRIGTVRRVNWQVHRHEPSVAVQSSSRSVERTVCDNWRLDPAIAGGGILLDHGYHALYIVLSWLNEEPRTVAATLEKRTHPEWPVEDTATVRLHCPESVADIFLTWAASSRSNSAVIEGTSGTIRVDDDILLLTDNDGQQRWEFEQSLSKGSHHPDWFSRVRDDFLQEISDTGQRGKNLARASCCVQLLHRAKESHARAGQPLAVSDQRQG
jgi:predicted dehydrogenase